MIDKVFEHNYEGKGEDPPHFVRTVSAPPHCIFRGEDQGLF